MLAEYPNSVNDFYKKRQIRAFIDKQARVDYNYCRQFLQQPRTAIISA